MSAVVTFAKLRRKSSQIMDYIDDGTECWGGVKRVGRTRGVSNANVNKRI